MSRLIRKPIFLIPLGMLLVSGLVAAFWLWRESDGVDGEVLIPGSLLLISGGLPGLSIDRLPGYTLSREKGPDFDVYYLSAEDGSAGLGAYIGRHPNSFRPKTGCVEEPGMLCAERVKWYVWEKQIDGNTVFAREAYHTFGKEWGRMTVHASISCDDQAHMATLLRVANNIRVVPEPKDFQPTQDAGVGTTRLTTQPE